MCFDGADGSCDSGYGDGRSDGNDDKESNVDRKKEGGVMVEVEND